VLYGESPGRHHVTDGYVALYMEGSAAEAIGVRATLVPYIADADPYDYLETLASNRRMLERDGIAADGRVRTWVGLEHLFYCKPETLRSARVNRRVRHRASHSLL
jgi:hypothetical protein